MISWHRKATSIHCSPSLRDDRERWYKERVRSDPGKALFVDSAFISCEVSHRSQKQQRPIEDFSDRVVVCVGVMESLLSLYGLFLVRKSKRQEIIDQWDYK